eukprot:gene20562-40376_t
MHAQLSTGIFGAALFWGPARRAEIAAREAAEEIVEFLEIETIRDVPVGTLSYGLQKRVELGRALAMRPRLLLLDEMVSGMNQEETEDIARFILDIREERGITVMMIEHDMGIVMDISDHVTVLNFGRKIAEGTPAEVSANPAVNAGMSRPDSAMADRELPPGVREGQATLPGLLRHRARQTPDRIALREKVRGIWQGITWAEYFEKVQAFALYLRAQGFGAGDKLVIASDGSPEWFYADLAAQSLGGVTVGIYPTNPWPELQYIVRHCRAGFAVCGDQEQTDKVLDAMRNGDGLPDLKQVLTVDTKGMRHYDE